MNRRDRNKLISMFNASVLITVLLFFLVLAIPFTDLNGTPLQRAVAYLVAAAFWICLIIIVILSLKCGKIRRKYEEYNTGRLGVLSFFGNRKATAADIVFLLSLVFVIVVAVKNLKNTWLVITGIGILFCSFILHCLLNGRNYRYIREIYDEGEEKEDE